MCYRARMSGSVLPRLRVIHHLARTGGTVISKCIASLPGVVLLSEVHPVGMGFKQLRLYNPLVQAGAWFGLISRREFDKAEAEGMGFAEAIALIEGRASARGKVLVIRDWTHLDYTGLPFVRRPPMRMLLPEALADRFDLTRIATVRHPIDQWLSLTKLPGYDRIRPAMFMPGYRRFAEHAAEMGFIRYEDFTRQPDAQMRLLCGRLDLAFDTSYASRWADYRTITGDNTGRSSGSRRIEPLPRRQTDPALLEEFRNLPDYGLAIRLLGYAED